MTKNRIITVLLIAVSVFVLAGAGLTIGLLASREDRNTLNLKLTDGEAQTMVFESLAMAPGDTVSYDVSLKNDTDGACRLSFDFVEEEISPLKEFVYVTVMLEDETVIENRLLAELLDSDEAVSIECELRRTQPSSLTVSYRLPLEVDNRAQNATASFVLHITANNT